MSEKRFDGLTVMITGSSGGFGSQAAHLFAGEGANLVLSDYSDEDNKRIADVLRATGCKVADLAGDISDEETARKLVALAMDEFGQLDVAMNNAGIGHTPARTPQVDSEEARRVIDVDLMSVFYCMKHQIPVMEKQYRDSGKVSSILNIASVAGLVGAPSLSIYAAAKHGVVGLTKTAALEYARRGVRINAMCPAWARTALVEEGMLGEADDKVKAEDMLVRGIPMRRVADPAEITQAMLWACDPKNTFMTGHSLAV
ncbi:MAG: SDR family oxidoreductase, partial [Hyphomicrobiales bacterium]|nr:SDR family oxidoreductase [Hyphomicrobiales bacterium]